MINEANPTGKVSNEESSDGIEQVTEEITELSEDMEMVSPGAMLREARKVLSLSQDHIASKLNLKLSLVNNIEEDIFDPSMPVTFNRGYLTNYAKLVGVDIVDVLASYDALDAASIQRSEMLSFSKETSKQAEHSRVMWLSYLIVAILVGLTILWFQQETNQQDVNTNSTEPEPIKASLEENTLNAKEGLIGQVDEPVKSTNLSDLASAAVIKEDESTNQATPSVVIPTTNDNMASTEVSQEPVMSTAVFTFKGDCWVNIHDATGERIAWGVKKSGYVMTIQGKAPLRITVGKPELTSIVFNNQSVDMSAFDIGNIAKFTLPIIVN
jgi:cytoskeleton protein RodZ